MKDIQAADSAAHPRPSLVRRQLVRELHELIAALDRRVPRMERVGEASIARDAAALKTKALKRIAEIERESAPSPCRVQGHPGAATRSTGEG